MGSKGEKGGEGEQERREGGKQEVWKEETGRERQRRKVGQKEERGRRKR